LSLCTLSVQGRLLMHGHEESGHDEILWCVCVHHRGHENIKTFSETFSETFSKIVLSKTFCRICSQNRERNVTYSNRRGGCRPSQTPGTLHVFT
jgi:hypothetical protein